jgi:hypothetical protein
MICIINVSNPISFDCTQKIKWFSGWKFHSTSNPLLAHADSISATKLIKKLFFHNENDTIREREVIVMETIKCRKCYENKKKVLENA